jgi:hypothetical protein
MSYGPVSRVVPTAELHGLEPSVLIKALELMERDGRAELHRGPGVALDEVGVKFK